MADKLAVKTENDGSDKRSSKSGRDVVSAVLRHVGFKRGVKVIIALAVIALPLIFATANYGSLTEAAGEPASMSAATPADVSRPPADSETAIVGASAASAGASPAQANTTSAQVGASGTRAGGEGQASGAGTAGSDPAAAMPDDISGAQTGEETGEATGETSGETSGEKDDEVDALPLIEETVTSPSVVIPEPIPGKVAYITIDDGPSRAITPAILDVLKAEGVKATFFVLPHNRVDDIYRRIIDEGHEMGNHSYSHRYSYLYATDGLSDFIEDVKTAQEFILDNFGYEMTSFRFPGGSMGWGASVITPRREALRELGFHDFDWHVDSGDARANMPDKSAATLTANVLNHTRNRDKLIVLMHDTQGKRTTLEALPRIIAGLRAQGYSFDILRNYYVEYVPVVVRTHIEPPVW